MNRPSLSDRRRLDRLRKGTERVYRSMQSGAELHADFRNGRRTWRLTTGEFIPDDVARSVIARPEIRAAGDCLIAGLTSQTYYIRKEN